MSTEETLLLSFLLGNELHDNITLQSFVSMFPIAFRNTPQIKELYREFQDQRNRIRETVRKNIRVEVELGAKEEEDEEEKDMFENEDDRPMEKEGSSRRNLAQALKALEDAEMKMDQEIREMERKCEEVYLPALQELDAQLRAIPCEPDATDPILSQVSHSLQDLERFCDDVQP
ncbi:uncharacterized protein VTP21DRAFT_8305 [Calcarisporiella thermophila]|uniref:uncharacterized protein n=1 Tax=Calcarisporiella thermophila TaxID=911321 RepID=UPI00374249EE